jgi:hypothetical protein
MRDRWGQTKKQAGGERENETYWKKEINRHNENASRLDIDK